ncbi:acyl-CoA dehydrogenase [Fodinicurvata sp. EGI_FJ10296]|uniref:acyl-CoA dehydrogenase family protein n=1 Tax=Fodinicurvata sp. EGI_FJ10296 TaxID=3231908 RepID=UPI003456ACC9
MGYALTEEQTLFQDSVRRFAQDKLAPGAVVRAQQSAYPWDIAAMMAEQGLMGIMIPEEHGGLGGKLTDAVIAIEQVALACPRSADVIQAGNFGAIWTFAANASPVQRERHFSDLINGKALISVAMTEPDAGSAVTDLKTTVTPDGDGYRLNGQKCFTTNSPEATLFLVYCRFGPGTAGIGSVIVERGMDGFTLGAPHKFMNGEEWQPLFFDNVYIPPENILLGEGGFKRQISGFNVERIGNTTRSLTLGRVSYEIARQHAIDRHQFGRPLCEFQGLQWKFADMLVQLEAARLLLWRAVEGVESGEPSAQDTAIAKIHCNKTGFDCCNEAMQIMGGAGYSDDSLVEYCFRKTRAWMIAGGSLEMMKNRIAEGIFERRFSQRPPKPAQ